MLPRRAPGQPSPKRHPQQDAKQPRIAPRYSKAKHKTRSKNKFHSHLQPFGCCLVGRRVVCGLLSCRRSAVGVLKDLLRRAVVGGRVGVVSVVRLLRVFRWSWLPGGRALLRAIGAPGVWVDGLFTLLSRAFQAIISAQRPLSRPYDRPESMYGKVELAENAAFYLRNQSQKCSSLAKNASPQAYFFCYLAIKIDAAIRLFAHPGQRGGASDANPQPNSARSRAENSRTQCRAT
jgi:hypothetical protein